MPLAPADGPIDIAHLRRMTLGDPALERDVLTMFLKQTAQLSEALTAGLGDRATLVHTLKGSARAIGAFGVAAGAEAVEQAIRTGDDPSSTLAVLATAAAEARASIAAILERS
jgi:HPt (histidine-containing phosphotransfer) domain-containing protein